jgi:hypothetical protein
MQHHGDRCKLLEFRYEQMQAWLHKLLEERGVHEGASVYSVIVANHDDLCVLSDCFKEVVPEGDV